MGDLLTRLLEWDQAGPVAILVLVLVSIMTGLLVPGWWVRRLMAEKDRQIATYESLLGPVRVVGKATETLLETVKSTAEARKDGDQP